MVSAACCLASVLLTTAIGTGEPLDLAGPWRFQVGDDPAWAATSFDDTGWTTVVVPTGWGRKAPTGSLAWYRRTRPGGCGRGPRSPRTRRPGQQGRQRVRDLRGRASSWEGSAPSPRSRAWTTTATASTCLPAVGGGRRRPRCSWRSGSGSRRIRSPRWAVPSRAASCSGLPSSTGTAGPPRRDRAAVPRRPLRARGPLSPPGLPSPRRPCASTSGTRWWRSTPACIACCARSGSTPSAIASSS